MLSLMQFGGIDPVGSSRIGSLPNPRRNTSKEFFEAFRSGDEVEPSLRSVSVLSPLNRGSDEERRQSGDTIQFRTLYP